MNYKTSEAMTIERQKQAIDIIGRYHKRAIFKSSIESRALIAANLLCISDSELTELFRRRYVVNIYTDIESQEIVTIEMWIS